MRRSVLISSLSEAGLQPGAWLALASVLCGVAVSACTPLKPRDDTPIDTAFGAVRAIDAGVSSPAASATDWSCLRSLGRGDSLVRPADEGKRWVYSVRVLSFLTGQVIPGLTFRACREADSNCLQPLTGAIAGDEDGWVDVPITEGFSGYFEITSPTTAPEILLYNRLLQSNGSLGDPVALLEGQALASLSAALGTPQNPNLGLLIMNAYGCNGRPADGIEFVHDRGGDPWYLVDSLPSFAAHATSPQGIGGFVNVAPGISVIQTTLEDGTPLAPPQSTFVRPGWVTALISDPSGEPE